VTDAINFSSMAELYEHFLVEPLFRPWVDELLQRAELAAGDRVLDVACGTGIAARVAKERLGAGARVVGIDASASMLAVARRLGPEIEWREGNAVALPVTRDEQFDVVVCQQGMQFFPDRLAATREMRRVLAPGGRVVVATWRPLQDVPLCSDLNEIAERHLGPVVDQRHTLGDPKELAALLEEAGFRGVRVDIVRRTIRFADPTTFFQMNANAIVGMCPAGKTMDEPERARYVGLIAEDSRQLLAKYPDGPGLAFELSTNAAIGRA
jgi:ubiquinone/menaquinone biosynthesis C-methylase UbiE